MGFIRGITIAAAAFALSAASADAFQWKDCGSESRVRAHESPPVPALCATERSQDSDCARLAGAGALATITELDISPSPVNLGQPTTLSGAFSVAQQITGPVQARSELGARRRNRPFSRPKCGAATSLGVRQVLLSQPSPLPNLSPLSSRCRPPLSLPLPRIPP